VFIPAAWGLRKLAVPETLPKVQLYVQNELDRILKNKPLPGRKDLADLVDHQLSQLNQLLGQQRYQPADPLLRRFIPKRIAASGEQRASAVWALGLLHEDRVDAGLATELEARLNDNRAIPPEDPRVRRMAAITLGRMKAVQSLPSLRNFWTGKINGDTTNDSCGWAIERITGEAIPAPETTRRPYRDWFLMP
jgi:hypothetical protein